jgi:hypothetical protein
MYEFWHTPENSLKDSNVSPKVKTMEEEGVGAHSLACNTVGVQGVHWSFEMGIRKSDKHVNYSYQSTQTKQRIS